MSDTENMKIQGAEHEVDPGWSVLYDNHRRRTCGVWVYKDAESGTWKHGGEE